jgi:hypothetical protein
VGGEKSPKYVPAEPPSVTAEATSTKARPRAMVTLLRAMNSLLRANASRIAVWSPAALVLTLRLSMRLTNLKRPSLNSG